MSDSALASLEQMAEKELVRRLNASGTARQFGFMLAVAEPRHVIMRMRVVERHKQVHGVVHGGVLAALADTAGGLATFMSVPVGSRVATVEMKINYLEPVARGTVFADARVLRVGKNLAVVDCDLRDEIEKLVGKALMTFSIGPMEAANHKPRKRSASSR
jgi:uncharacterized protein (TIGR00369 family)